MVRVNNSLLSTEIVLIMFVVGGVKVNFCPRVGIRFMLADAAAIKVGSNWYAV